MKYTGYYHDVPDDRPSRWFTWPSIKDQPRCTDAALVSTVAGYLKGGDTLFYTLSDVLDPLDPEDETKYINITTMTDGEWFWPGDAIYFCEAYGILPGAELVAKAVATHGQCPPISDAESAAAARTFRADEAAWRKEHPAPKKETSDRPRDTSYHGRLPG